MDKKIKIDPGSEIEPSVSWLCRRACFLYSNQIVFEGLRDPVNLIMKGYGTGSHHWISLLEKIKRVLGNLMYLAFDVGFE